MRKKFPACRQAGQQKTRLSASFLTEYNASALCSDLSKYTIPQNTDNVKYTPALSKANVDPTGIEPADSDSSDPNVRQYRAHTTVVYHILATLFILFTFHLSASLETGFPLITYLSPVYADHPVGTQGEYCVGEAGGERWFDASDGNHQFIPPKCSDQEDCREFTDSSDYNYTRCISRNTGSPPGSTTNFGPPPAGLQQIEAVFGRVISLFVGLAFVALAVVLVWAGIKFLTSGGDPKALEAARNTVTWALLGILFLAIAWLILQLIAAFTGIEGLKTFDVGKLCIPPVNLGNCVPKPTP